MSTETENALLSWYDTEDDVCDALHDHFVNLDRWEWCEIADEARRVWNLMFKDEVEMHSPMDAVWTAAAAQASYGAFAAVAAALGVKTFALQEAVAPWMENQNSPPHPIPAERLMELCEEATTNRRRLLASFAKGGRHG